MSFILSENFHFSHYIVIIIVFRIKSIKRKLKECEIIVPIRSEINTIESDIARILQMKIFAFISFLFIFILLLVAFSCIIPLTMLTPAAPIINSIHEKDQILNSMLVIRYIETTIIQYAFINDL